MDVRELSDFLEDYLDRLRSLNYSPFTIRISGYSIRSFLSWLRDVHRVSTADRLRKKHLHGWQKRLNEHRTRKGRPLKASSINKRIEGVRCFLTFLHKAGLTTTDLTEELRYVKTPQMLPQSVLTHAQVRKILSKIDTTAPAGQRDRTMLELMYSCGLRSGEVVKLDVRDIDIANALARIMGKGSKERIVPVGRTALRHLESYITAVRPLLVKDSGEQALFINKRGGRVQYHQILRTIHEKTEDLDLGINVTPHTFRRSCTTEMIRGNANIYHVKEFLGHATLKHLQPYIRLNIADLKKTHAKCHPREKDE